MLSPNEAKQFKLMKKDIAELKRQNAWMIREMKTGLKDIIERVVQQNIEIEVTEQSTDEKIKELIK